MGIVSRLLVLKQEKLERRALALYGTYMHWHASWFLVLAWRKAADEKYYSAKWLVRSLGRRSMLIDIRK